jgi:hypothetical protein
MLGHCQGAEDEEGCGESYAGDEGVFEEDGGEIRNVSPEFSYFAPENRSISFFRPVVLEDLLAIPRG